MNYYQKILEIFSFNNPSNLNYLFKKQAENCLKNIKKDKEGIKLIKEIYSFLSFYYKNGIFGYFNKKKDDDYKIDYNGSDVFFFYSMEDNYYIKTKDTITLKLIHNNKEYCFIKDRINSKKNNIIEVKEHNNNVMIYIYNVRNNKQDIDNIIKKIKTVLGNEFIIIYENKIKNNLLLKESEDYFIHKNLKSFLYKELDNYLLSKIKDIIVKQTEEQKIVIDSFWIKFKKYTKELINILSQIEEFKKTILLQKKNILKTDYIISIDKMLKKGIKKHVIINLIKDKQINEWIDLGLINKDFKKEDIINKKYLCIDTKYLNKKEKKELLSVFDNIDNELDGLLINSENLQGLINLKDEFKEKIQIVYIDPPFNTNSIGKSYKNKYNHSKWLCLIENRVSLIKDILSEDGILIIAIDEKELVNLVNLHNKIFKEKNKIGTIVTISNLAGRVSKKISQVSEYNLIYAKDIKKVSSLSIKMYGDYKNLMRTGVASDREEAYLRFYPILEKDGKLFMISDEEYIKIYDRNKKKFNDNYLKELIQKYNDLGYNVIIPKNKKGNYKVRQRKFERVKREIKYYIFKNNKIFIPPSNNTTPKSVWIDVKYNNPTHGTKLLNNMFGCDNLSRITPKSVYTVMDLCNLINSNYILDCFAGSGTTAHAVMKLNKEDGGKRKFILIELNDYFDTVIIPRIKKVAYSFNWKNGKPQDNDGIGIVVKYIYLEGYNDILNKKI